ncbi:uncharacterized protein GVI51_H09669 [Nakaseomyces glabratus]|uniref:Protein FMP52, mitochondrial n=2 Tax=Candida glabrata TaxID=5478 RepID=FMP52_CANGA|nr:uncharacterized protein CAGL0H09768g [Nakaseomyces glabratus]Q6FRC1.1 RecName: Full=Protein FMP52, mitochondrial; Flags: Precursor [Nakaseomyces glabratus CBS 138]KAH7586417.1 hypothetical protein J7298_02497 [Nakaseomyces glabratus]KAH7588002.1 hypothetical protein J7297_02492 [Nakaseomyces glabratus]KAH7592388.1 hypothetical protein J7296_02490 [Nakaseomyces glabratus]KAH7601034.1 hypothetical protein J7295_02503 [Nakaseomyces glabratus]KAH7606034.1 hypothetical protein J7293_02483 [Naka|eukprot:XP_447223.1 uncharacterized protein CAGL0H09768g [[Candida] glabrata]
MSKQTAVVLGATGLCGEHLLKSAVASQAFEKVYSISRRSLPYVADCEQIVDKDSSSWASLLPKENFKFLFTSLATTRAAAGGFDKQYQIDHDLNLELAKASKANGCETIVLVSSTGANKNSWMPYLRMKGEIEEDIIALNFKHTIILRPSALLGDRRDHHKGFGNDLFVKIGNCFYRSRLQSIMGYPVQGEEVGIAGVQAALQEAEKNTESPTVRYVGSSEILELVDNFKNNS